MDKYCRVCGTTYNLHTHHIFNASNRKHSEKYKLTCILCANCHTGSRGVHNNRELDLKLKREYQQKFESEIGSREEFQKIFGKSYIWE